MAAPPNNAPTLRVRRFAAWLIAAIALVYSNTLHVPFLFDDTDAVLKNPTIRHLGSLAVLHPPTDGSATTGRPVVNASLALNYALSGDAPWSYHLFNVVVHALAALTLMGLVRRTLAQVGFFADEPNRAAAAAFLAALIWAMHPLQTETITGIAQRTEALCGLLYLLTLYGFARAAERSSSETHTGARGWYGVSVAACLLGMGTKEVMVTAPVLVVLYDRTFFAASFASAFRRRRGYYAALACTWLLLGWLVLQGGGTRGTAAGFGLTTSPWLYLLTQAKAIVLYLKLALWPHPLVLDYGTEVSRGIADVWGQGMLMAALLGATGWALVRRPIAGFIGAGVFLILAPSSSIVPLVTQTIAEHRMYLPLAALAAGVSALLMRRLPRAAPWLLGATALGLALIALRRNHDYRDAVTIWNDTVHKRPENARAHNNLAWSWQQAGNAARANVHFARAVALQPDYVSARYNWGMALLQQGRTADAIPQLEAAVRLVPAHADAQLNLGTAFLRVDRGAEALACFDAALRLRPAADAHYNRGVALAELGRADEAAAAFAAALKLDPHLAAAQFQLARQAEQAGRLDEAETRYAETLRLAPDHAAAHAKLGLLLARAGRLDAAAEHLRSAIRLRPDDADSHANLGNVLLLQAQPRAAIESYEKALRLRPNDPRTRESIRLAREALP